MTHYTVFVLGQVAGWLWAERVITGDQYGSCDPDNGNTLWFVVGSGGKEEAVASFESRPGVEIKVLEADDWRIVTPDSVRAANQKESSQTAQTAAE